MTNEQYTEILHLRIQKLEEALQLMCDAVTEHRVDAKDCDQCDGFERAKALWKESDRLEQVART